MAEQDTNPRHQCVGGLIPSQFGDKVTLQTSIRSISAQLMPIYAETQWNSRCAVKPKIAKY
jgi:hypothetical protein